MCQINVVDRTRLSEGTHNRVSDKPGLQIKQRRINEVWWQVCIFDKIKPTECQTEHAQDPTCTYNKTFQSMTVIGIMEYAGRSAQEWLPASARGSWCTGEPCNPTPLQHSSTPLERPPFGTCKRWSFKKRWSLTMGRSILGRYIFVTNKACLTKGVVSQRGYYCTSILYMKCVH